MIKNKIANEFFVNAFNIILNNEQEDMRKIFANEKISITEIHILEAVNRTNPSSMNAIANRLHVTSGSLTTSTSQLIKKGYLTKEVNKLDRRIKTLQLTKDGMRVIKEHDLWHENLIDSILSTMSKEEITLIENALLKVTDNFNK